MLDDITKEIKVQLYERARTPLTGAFVISWVAWNYRPLLNILSDADFSEKLAYLNTFYPTNFDHLTFGFIYPLLSATAFILIYPFPARWAYHYWHWQQNKTKGIRQRIEDETPITQEEARQLRKVSSEAQRQLQIQLTEQTAANNEISNRLHQAEEERNKLLDQVEQLENKHASLLQDKEKLEREKNFMSTKLVETEDALDNFRKQFPQESDVATSDGDKAISGEAKLPNNVIAELARRSIDGEKLKLFVKLIQEGGAMNLSVYLSNFNQLQRIEIQSAARGLAGTGYVASIGNDLRLTAQGEDLAVQLKLTKLLTN